MRAGTFERMIVLAAIAVVVAAGLCLFDADQGAHGLCLSLLSTTLMLHLAYLLAPTGYVPLMVAEVYRLYPSDLPAPPPRA